MIELVMTIRGFGENRINLELRDLKATAAGEAWAGPGLPRNMGTARVQIDPTGKVVKVTPESQPSSLAETIASMRQ